MALLVQDVITQDFVRDAVEEFVEEDLVYRQVYQQIDATDIGSNAYQFNVAQDDMGRVRVVPEGAEVPRHQSTVKEVTVTFDKFVGEVAISMEAEQDGLIDMKAREVDDLARAMDETLNNQAFNELNNNYKTTVGNQNDSMEWSDIKDGIIEVRRGHYNPDTLILDLDAYGDLLTSSTFNRATQQGDSVVDTGEIGQIANMEVIVDPINNIGDDNGSGAGNGAFIVDSNKFGYELRRTPMGTNRYEANERMVDIIQVFTRRAWKHIFSDAAVRIDG